MSTSQIKAIKFEVEQVGKKIKGTKRKYLWVLNIGQRVYNFILDDSLLSGKSKLSINGRIFHEIELGIGGCNYSHQFIVDQCLFNISYANDFYQMRINNNSFSHYLGIQKKKEEFQEHKVEESSFGFADFSKPISHKKITMALPGMGNTMKKKKGPSLQSENWSAFCQSGSFNPFTSQTPTPSIQAEKDSVNNQQPKQTQISQTQQNPTASQFITRQDLFKTICTSKPYEKIAKEGQTPTYQLQEIPALPEINLQEFSTIQQLFATSCPQPPQTQSVFSEAKDSEHVQKKQQIKMDDFSFNTMQQLFQTLKTGSLPSNKQQQIAKNAPIISVCDFNTMQKLFATNAGQIKTENQQNKSQSHSIDKKNAFDQFHTIQCVLDVKGNDKFSTFTQNLALGSANKLNSKISTSQEVKKQKFQHQKLKTDDFNTMQNLFKTNLQCKKQNEFWKF